MTDMTIRTTTPATFQAAPVRPAETQSLDSFARSDSNSLTDFYRSYQTPIHVAGGALMGAGIAHFAGLSGQPVLAAAGSGALAGFFAGGTRGAVMMGGGALVGAGIAAFAGMPGAAVVSAAGTGTFAGWLLNHFA